MQVIFGLIHSMDLFVILAAGQFSSWNQWELVIDNGSGTYAPNLNLLENLKDLLTFNFPQLNIVTYDYKDQRLQASTTACQQFAKEPQAKPMQTLKCLVLSPMKN